MHIYMLPGTDPCRNLAIEECLLRSRSDDILLLWRNSNTVVVGRNQNTLAEINTDFAQKNNIRVVRRISGGGAVYHDLGNINFSYLTMLSKSGPTSMNLFTHPVATALRKLGVPAECSGRNDILVNGRKISGNAQAIIGQRLLHHGTLLFQLNGKWLEQALRPNPEKLRSKGIDSVRTRVAGINEFLPQHVTAEVFTAALLYQLVPGGVPETLCFSETELHTLQQLEAKYRSWEWTYGKNPAFSLHCTRCFAGGCVEVHLEVAHGHITNCTIFGDFMSLRPIDTVCMALQGIRHQYNDMAAVLSHIPLKEYLGTITLEELLSCFCLEKASSQA